MLKLRINPIVAKDLKNIKDYIAEDLSLIHIEAGIDIIELGIPFSDPTADGPVIQDASYRSICKGTNLKGVFAAVEEVRKDCDVPLVFMM